MKHSGLPTIAVGSKQQLAAESTSPGSESDSGFAETPVRFNIGRHYVRHEFVSRALVAREEAKRSGQYVSSDEMLSRLDARLVAARVRQIG